MYKRWCRDEGRGFLFSRYTLAWKCTLLVSNNAVSTRCRSYGINLMWLVLLTWFLCIYASMLRYIPLFQYCPLALRQCQSTLWGVKNRTSICDCACIKLACFVQDYARLLFVGDSWWTLPSPLPQECTVIGIMANWLIALTIKVIVTEIYSVYWIAHVTRNRCMFKATTV